MLVAVVAELIIFRPLRNSPPLAKLVASLGLLLTLQASMLLAFGTLPQHRAADPAAQKTVAMLGAVVPINRFIIAGIVIVATGAADGGVPLDELRPRDARGVGERDVGHAARALAEAAVR